MKHEDVACTSDAFRRTLWSSGQWSWLQTHRSGVRLHALLDFLEKGSTQARGDKWGATWKKSSGSGLENWDQRPWGIRRADHATPLYLQKLALNFADNWRLLSLYSSLADWKATEFLSDVRELHAVCKHAYKSRATNCYLWTGEGGQMPYETKDFRYINTRYERVL
jgi:hypothetical protein